MQTRPALSCRKQSGHIRHLGISIHPDTSHHVVGGRTDFHRLLRYVDVGELLELVIHAGQLLLDALRCVRNFLFDPCDIEEHTAMRTATAFSYLAADATGNMVPSQ